MNRWILIVGLFLLLWATPIGPEEFFGGGRPLAAPSATLPPTLVIPPVRAKKIDRKMLHFKEPNGIDEQTFMREFKFQAHRDGLFECLNVTLPSPRSMLLEAVILTSGVVSQVERGGNAKALPACANEVLRKMKFPQTGATMVTASHTVVWRVDW